MPTKRQQILELAKQRGAIRPRDLRQIGVSPSYLGHLMSRGELIRSSRGLYTLATFELTQDHTLVEAVRTQPKGVVCLLSALAFHHVGTQLPHQVWLAVPFGSWIAKPSGIPIRTVVMRHDGYFPGIERHQIEGVEVPVYSVAKTIADCFKFRQTIGIGVAIEALREALRDRRCTRDELHRHAKALRVERVMRPYLEALSA
ncbi:MAG: type IV toxin-antitoxin system AbiEi family antitoxin domain-containing protein [Armatimonadetes bacterium]|nr:type IV toxin-antitoxin system AbiEi family antitoxin domain-containing protein [Armatimonadota bacterium]